jgi:hypothetical protein
MGDLDGISYMRTTHGAYPVLNEVGIDADAIAINTQK